MSYSMDLRWRVVAAAQDGQAIAQVARRFTIARRFAEADRFVFLDESGARTHMTRLYGRSPVGQRCIDRTPYGRWKTMTVLGAIRVSGVIQDASVVIDGPMNSDTFLAYTQQCLARRCGPATSWRWTTSPRTKPPVCARRSKRPTRRCGICRRTRPTSTPSEKLWSKVKAWLRRVTAKTFDGLTDAIADALRDVQVNEYANYFNSCGYGDAL